LAVVLSVTGIRFTEQALRDVSITTGIQLT
jgi:hypothetical protein